MRSIILLLAFVVPAVSADSKAEYNSVIKEAQDLRRQSLALSEKADAALWIWSSAWIKTANLEPIPVPELGPDPRESEVAAHALAEKINLQKKSLLIYRAQFDRKQDERDTKQGILNGVINIGESDTWSYYEPKEAAPKKEKKPISGGFTNPQPTIPTTP